MAATPIEPTTPPTRGLCPEWLRARVVLSFVLVAALVFWWGWNRHSKRTQHRSYRATSVVYHELPPEWAALAWAPSSSEPTTSQPAGSIAPEPLVEKVRELALSPGALRRALDRTRAALASAETDLEQSRRSGLAASATSEETREAGSAGGTQSSSADSNYLAGEQLDVEVANIAGPDGLRVAICCEDTSPERAALTANALAECYVEQLRAGWQEQMQRRCAEAQAAAARAHDELLKAQGRLDLFLQSQAAAQAKLAQPSIWPATPDPAVTSVAEPGGQARNAPQQDASAPLPQIKRGRTRAPGPDGRRIKSLSQDLPGELRSRPVVRSGDRPERGFGIGSNDENTHNGLIENPRWIEANERVEQLRTRQAELLETRTRSHPVVQQVEQDLREAEAQLAAEPRFLPDTGSADSDSPGASNSAARRVANPYVHTDSQPAPPSPTNTQPPAVARAPSEPDRALAADWPEAGRSRAYNSGAAPESASTPPEAAAGAATIGNGPTPSQLRRQLEQAAAAFDRATRREREAWQSAARQPRIEWQAARALAAPARRPVWRLLFAAMLAGLLGAGGVGLISAGVGIQPVLLTVAEAEAAVGAPLAGCIPAGALGLESDGLETVRPPDWARPALMLTGLALLVACLAGAWAWIG